MLNKGELDQGELASSHEDIKTLFRNITEIQENIKKIELETLRVQQGADVVLCPKCGAANKIGDKFCSSCGSATAAEAISDSKICPSCKAHVKEDAKFCIRCGGKTI